MLSIIICSKSPTLANAVSVNIRDTIQLEHEILIIDNSVNPLPIGQQYNSGAANAKFDYLLFIHEDVAFKKEGWGDILLTLLKDRSIGLVGVAGSKLYPASPGTWPNSRKFIRENVFHHEKHFFENPDLEIQSEVVTLDGVFLACRKEVWSSVMFDNHITGFHFYDLEFSLSIFKNKLKLIVTFEIIIDHFSLGSLNKSWIDQSILFFDKWKSFLPLSCVPIDTKELTSIKSDKIRDYINIFCINNDGSNRLWLLQLYLNNIILFNYKTSKLIIRYLLTGKIKVRSK